MFDRSTIHLYSKTTKLTKLEFTKDYNPMGNVFLPFFVVLNYFARYNSPYIPVRSSPFLFKLEFHEQYLF